MIYLDAAATTFQKPRTVAAAVERAMHYMTTPGRGAYQEARLAAEAAFRCRSEAAAVYWAVLKGRLCYLWEPGASPLFFTGIPGGILIDGITAVIADAALRGGQEKSGNYTA